MELLLDSADPQEIQEVTSWGLICGVTTNPSLYGRAGTDFGKRLHEIVEVSPGYVFTQVIGWHNTDDMVKQAKWLADQSDKIVVKLPTSLEGLQALQRLKGDNPSMRIAVTAVASVAQAYLSAKAGADVVALFNGPLDLEVDTPYDMVTPVRKIFDNYGYKAKILCAGRFPRGLGEYAAAGVDMATFKKEFHKLLYEHAYTDKRMQGFSSDWTKAFGDKTWLDS